MRIETAPAVVASLAEPERVTPKKEAPAPSPVPAQQKSGSVRAAAPPVPQPHGLSIQINEHGQVVYSVTDAQTGEVLRQIPAKEMQRVMRQVAEMQQAMQQKHAVDVEI